MKVVLQKVKDARVVKQDLYNEINDGYVLLVGVSENSTSADALKLAEKIAKSRNFEDDEGKINLSIDDVKGEILSISQFTLYADVKKGNRPSFTRAAKSDRAIELYKEFNAALESYGITVKEGFFGEHMNVYINNDGPITIIYESQEGRIL